MAKNGFAEMRQRIIEAEALKSVAREQRDRQYKMVDENYKGEFAKKERERYRAEYEAFETEKNSELFKMNSELRKSTHEQISKQVTAAPSSEALNAVNLLSQRKNVSLEEMQYYLDRYGSNYAIQQRLAEVASDSGLLLIVSDFTEVEQECDEMCDLFEKMIVSASDESYMAMAFYGDYPEYAIQQTIKKLDSDLLSQVSAPTLKRAELTANESELLTKMFAGVADVGTAVKEAAQSPAIKSLIEKSETYAPYLKAEGEE